MVGQSRRKSRPKKLLGSHQRCWIWGRHVVMETLRAGKWPPLELILSDGLGSEELDTARRAAERHRLPVRTADAAELSRLCRTGEHQGYVARMGPFPYDDAERLLDAMPAPAALALLDSVQDPFNFGAIVRAAEVLGIGGMIVGQARQAEVSSLVARSSAGAVNHLPIARVASLADAVEILRSRGLRVVGASEKATTTPFECDFRGPTAIVIGNEGAGVDPAVLRQCHQLVAVPQKGQTASLNAAVAAGILFYELQRQRSRCAGVVDRG